MELLEPDGVNSVETVELLICTTCKGEEPLAEHIERPGARLADGVAKAALAEDLPAGIQLKRVACLSNCKRSCTIALRGPGRWTYVYGNLDPDTDVAMLLEGTAKYAQTTDGLIPWRERPVHFRKNCIARIPPLEFEP